MRVLRWFHGISVKDHARSEEVQQRTKVKPTVAHVTKRRLSLFLNYGYIRRRYPEYITIMLLDKCIHGNRL